VVELYISSSPFPFLLLRSLSLLQRGGRRGEGRDSLPSPLNPYPPLSSLPFEVGPLNPARGSGGAL